MERNIFHGQGPKNSEELNRETLQHKHPDSTWMSQEITVVKG